MKYFIIHTGEGLYISAKAYELIDTNEIERPVGHFMGTSPRRIYKAIPDKFWINVGEEVNGYYNDSRIEVFLLSHK